MRRLLPFFSLIFLIPMGVSAYSVSCSGIPDASGCQQCFHFDLATSNAANDIFVPRSGIPTGQQEYIDLSKSTISGYAYQGASVSPTGNITGIFDRFESGPNATASWVWAKTKSGQGITRGNIPANIDYSKPVYSVKYTTYSYLKNQSTSSVVPGTEVSHLECGFFYANAPVVTPQIICGDGKKEGTEQCDDGNTNNNDGCSNACRLPVCGNGVREGSEECDDGNNRNGDACTSQCRNAGVNSICGNGIREGNEECDDGNTNNNDGCSNACRLPVCGNGVREGSEECDDGNNRNGDACTSQCRNAGVNSICGNGIREGNEECDDGNTNNNDGCSNACRLPVCGNGVREGSEECDDGNNRNGDACTSQCRNAGVNSICGNGIREGNEECDDGNASNTDTCSTICRAIGGANPQCRVQAFDSYGSVPLTTTLSCSGEPRGRTVIIITKNNTLVDTSETTSKTFTFNQSGRYTIRCFPDAANNQANSCTTVINVDGQCGNGIIERGEMCDDGNTISGDLCDRSCRLTGTSCGNGILENGEQCDDGNNSNNDTCTNICQTGTPDTGPLGMMTLLVVIAILGSAGIVYYRKRKS